MLLLRQSDVSVICRISAYSEDSWSLFEYKNVVFNGEQEKESCEDGIEKTIQQDHLLSSLGMPR